MIAALCGIAIGVGLGSLLGHGPQRAMLATALSVGAFYVASLAIGPFFTARLQNTVWNHTTLGTASAAKSVRSAISASC